MPPVKSRAPATFRRPQHPSLLLFALILHCAASGHLHSFFSSPDRRVRPYPKQAAADINSGEKSTEEETIPETPAAPPTSPRRADHRGRFCTSWSTTDRRERVMPHRRHRPPPFTGTLDAGRSQIDPIWSVGSRSSGPIYFPLPNRYGRIRSRRVSAESAHSQRPVSVHVSPIFCNFGRIDLIWQICRKNPEP